MKILIISTVPHDKEGRINRMLSQISNKDIYIYSPEVLKKEPDYKYFSISKKTPVGYKSQLKFYFQFKRKFRKNHPRDFFDIIFVLNYTSLPFYKIATKRNKKAKIIYDSFELIMKTKNEKNLLRTRFYIKQEKLITKRTQYIISANEQRALIMQGYYRLEQKPYVIQNIPLEKYVSKTKTLEGDKISIVYLGYISKTRKIDKLIHYISSQKKWDLYIYGDGDFYQEMFNYVKKKNLQNIYIMGRYNQEDIKEILSKHQIGYICYDTKGLNNIYCEPNKIYDYTFHNIPLVSFFHPKLYQIFEQHQIGVSSDDILKGINKIIKEYDYYQEQIVRYNQFLKSEIYNNQKVLSTIIESIKNNK